LHSRRVHDAETGKDQEIRYLELADYPLERRGKQ
jgi:hypothetical protein